MTVGLSESAVRNIIKENLKNTSLSQSDIDRIAIAIGVAISKNNREIQNKLNFIESLID